MLWMKCWILYNLDFELSQLDKKELSHLEEEFKDYKELYPREK